jgi:hypothetical protein
VAQGDSVEGEHEKASGPLLRELMAITLAELGHGGTR